MRLVRRLTLSMLLAIGFVLAIDTTSSVREHLALFDADLRRDERMLGRGLAHAIEWAWRDHGEAYALDLVREANDREGGVRIRFVFLEDPPGTPHAPEASPPAIEAARRDRSIVHTRDGEQRLYTYVPLAIPGDRIPALELSESLDHESAYLTARIREKLATAALMVLACGVVAWILGVRLVGRPIQQLVEKARRIGTGDFSGPLILGRHGEFSQLATEMNAMAERLDAAAREFSAESAARIGALEQLRHADRLTTAGQLASGLAHELGTPLNVVSGRAKMLASGELGGPEDTAKTARIIAEQADRMARIVRQLLDFARRRGSEKRATDLAQLARQTTALLEPFAARRRVALHCAHAEPLITAAVDATQLEQALTNLVMNGIQATPHGGVVSIRVASSELAPGGAPGRPPGAYAVIEVEDDGMGIPADHVSEIFDPFYTTKPVGEGTGLGLSVAHGIAQEHGGWIDVRSEPGRGSAFRIWLPREAGHEGPHPGHR